MRHVRPRIAALVLAVLSIGQSVPGQAAPTPPGIRAPWMLRSREGVVRSLATRPARGAPGAAAATTTVPHDGGVGIVRSAPDGAGGTYVAWSDSPDGAENVFLVRVTTDGTPAAGWPATGLRVCAVPGYQQPLAVLGDGANGVVVVWRDARRSFDAIDLYAQRVNSAGVTQWAENGVLLGLSQSYDERVAPDGTGGVLAVWNVGRDTATNVVGNRVTGAGANAAGWSANGTPICSAADAQRVLDVIGDGLGGGYFLWKDNRGPQTAFYGQHVNAAGVALWAANGALLAGEPDGVDARAVCADASGGLIVTWSGAAGLLAQHFDATGAEQWTAGGVTVLAGQYPYQVALSTAPSGTTSVAWNAFGTGVGMEVRAQSLDSAGAPQWNASGVVLRDTDIEGGAYELACVGDGLGGGIVTWLDTRGSADVSYSAYTQRVSSAGALMWGPEGVLLAGPPALTSTSDVLSDGAGGGLFTWLDYTEWRYVIRAQRLNASGTPQLAAGGAQVTASEAGTQLDGLTVHDGTNGAWVVWRDAHGSDMDVRARHLGPTGAPLGATVVLSARPGQKYLLDAASDGAGGIVVGWQEYGGDPDGNLRVQRVGTAGNVMWAAGGVAVVAGTDYRFNPRMAGDGAGGAFFAWSTYNADYDVAAQRVDATGAVRWGANGQSVCALGGFQNLGAITADGAGGMLCAWADYRQLLNTSMYVQRLNSDGVAQWAADGVPITMHGRTNTYPAHMVSDGANGAIVLIDSQYPSADGNSEADTLKLQRVNAAGVPQWGAAGVDVLALGQPANSLQLVSDGLSGAIVAWEDARTAPVDLYAQRVNGAGAVQWAANGAPVCTAPDWQMLSGLAADGAGGAFVSWADGRGHGDYDLYAQHLAANGSPSWAANGLVVCGAARGQYGGGICADATGGAIVGWTDNRAGNARNVVAQRVQSNGAVRWAVDGVTSVLVSLVDASRDGGRAQLAWHVSASGPAGIERASGSAGWTRIAERSPDGDGLVRFDDAGLEPGVRYGYRLIVTGTVGSVAAGEVWLETGTALALEAPSPNPVHRAFALSFTLPGAGPARLELFDVRGRRVALRQFAAVAPGRHVARFDDAHLAAGVYFARLVQGAAARQARVVVVE